MRIAFDLDDTLIPTTGPFAAGERRLGPPAGLWFREALRTGAPALMQTLAKDHEIWIYTTSLRKPWLVKAWFRLWGVRIGEVVNQDDHREAVAANQRYSRFSKAPRLFGIDLMIDDLPGVGIECERQGCRSVIVAPDDPEWVEKVLVSVQ
ncbi:hypothetical protein [Hahella sp. NBU794]|uniref:hypothetical protein n=1 Tax=Hahella sp. NBU794 TaxID=3422590 RepID=UPI003D6F0594